MWKLAIIGFRICIAVYISLAVILYVFQRSYLYYPQDRLIKDHTLRLATDVGHTIVSSIVQSDAERAIIYFGGNAEDVSVNLPEFKQIFRQHSLYLMHYRGYGGSSGKPSETAIYEDAERLFELVKLTHDEVVIMGRSLGSGVATYIASQYPVNKLVLITPYSSIEDLAKERFWFLPIKFMLKDKFLSWHYAKQVEAETAILMAEHDDIIPESSTLKLYKSFKPDTAAIYLFKGANHNNISADNGFYQLLKQLVSH